MKSWSWPIFLILICTLGCKNFTGPSYDDTNHKNDSTYKLQGTIVYDVNNDDKAGMYSYIYILNLSDYNKRTFKHYLNSLVYELSVSPDGKRIAYRKDNDKINLITTCLDSINGIERIVASNDSSYNFPCCPSWTHDNKLAYLFGKSFSYQLNIQTLVLNVGRNIAAGRTAFSKDGKFLIFSSYDDFLHASLYIFNLIENTNRLLVKADSTYAVLRIVDPAISPDDSRIVFTKDYNANQSTEIWVVNIDGTNLKKLSSSEGYSARGYPAWSPDGKKVAFVSAYKIFVMNDDGSAKMRLNDEYVEDFVWIN